VTALSRIPRRQKAPFTSVLALMCLQACSFGPVSATSCSVRKAPGHTVVLIATLTNNSSKPVRHVSVLVHTQGIRNAGGSLISYEYDFQIPLAPHQSVRSAIGKEYRGPEDLLRISCESAKAPANCRELKREGYKMPLPAGLPTIVPLHVGEDARMGTIDECWARLVVYSDGSGWSASPL
jgi:hypothetical protein